VRFVRKCFAGFLVSTSSWPFSALSKLSGALALLVNSLAQTKISKSSLFESLLCPEKRKKLSCISTFAICHASSIPNLFGCAREFQLQAALRISKQPQTHLGSSQVAGLTECGSFGHWVSSVSRLWGPEQHPSSHSHLPTCVPCEN